MSSPFIESSLLFIVDRKWFPFPNWLIGKQLNAIIPLELHDSILLDIAVQFYINLNKKNS